MAQKQPAKDAVSAAMSAIENALNLSGDGHEAGPATPAEPSSGRNAPPCRRRSSRPARRLPPSDDIKSPLVADPPANDDRAAIGPILQALAVGRPTLAPVIAATIGSLLWLALCGAYVAIHFPWSGGGDAVRQYLTRPETVLLALAALGPMILFFGFAALARRLNELRLSARSITQVALRLAEPETVASENVASLAQAIRREIGTMGDGIERALARAAELETLVRSEVTTLERAYSDNERRIRSLIAEMADQREAILASGGRVRAVIDDAHRGIANDLEAIAIRLGERVSGVGGDVAATSAPPPRRSPRRWIAPAHRRSSASTPSPPTSPPGSPRRAAAAPRTSSAASPTSTSASATPARRWRPISPAATRIWSAASRRLASRRSSRCAATPTASSPSSAPPTCGGGPCARRARPCRRRPHRRQRRAGRRSDPPARRRGGDAPGGRQRDRWRANSASASTS